MFRILKYQHDLVSDAVEIRVIFQLKPKGNIIEDGGMFTKKRNGDAWLYQVKKDYFNIKLENYLVHKKFIIESSVGHKSNIAKKQSLAELYKYLEWACTKASLYEACKWAIQMKKHFETILPSPNNPSYNSSNEAIDEIIEFAKLHQNGVLIN